MALFILCVALVRAFIRVELIWEPLQHRVDWAVLSVLCRFQIIHAREMSLVKHQILSTPCLIVLLIQF